MKPTDQAYSELQYVYEHFNKHLFEGKLPPCLITLQRNKNTYGYFSENRFKSKDGMFTDEIALNPVYFSSCTLQEIFQTLVHEMVHLQQSKFGKPGRGRYHNKEWGVMMEAIGLIPSSTGAEGGKKTGDNMAEYPAKDGLFLKACANLITSGFKISWADSFPPREVVMDLINSGEEVVKNWNLEDLGLVEIEETGEVILGENNKSNRMKYTCSGCRSNIWGKATINAFCDDCKMPFIHLS